MGSRSRSLGVLSGVEFGVAGVGFPSGGRAKISSRQTGGSGHIGSGKASVVAYPANNNYLCSGPYSDVQ